MILVMKIIMLAIMVVLVMRGHFRLANSGEKENRTKTDADQSREETTPRGLAPGETYHWHRKPQAETAEEMRQAQSNGDSRCTPGVRQQRTPRLQRPEASKNSEARRGEE